MHDRRKYPRFRAREGAVAVPRSSDARIGRIMDISSGGLAVHHASEEDWLSGSSRIDILTIDSDYYLSKIPVRVVSEQELIKKSSHGLIKERRWGLQFGDLSDRQIIGIQFFIHNFTIKPERL